MAQSGSSIVGHGELIKALNETPEGTHLRFRVAVVYLAHITPPRYYCYPSAKTIADSIGCSVKTVHRTKLWLVQQGAVTTKPGCGRGRTTVVSFMPLVERVRRQREKRKGCKASDIAVTELTGNGGRRDTVCESERGSSESLNNDVQETGLSGQGDSEESPKGPNKDLSARGRTTKGGLKPLSETIPDLLACQIEDVR
jgi:hypothetical protein